MTLPASTGKMIAENIKDLKVLTETGEQVPLGSLWAGQITVLAFVRHFG